MEWLETTAKTLDEAKELALDRLGVAADEAEFDVLEEPRPGLFGRLRGEARIRARVKPAPVRPKHDRRRRKAKADERPKSDTRRTGRRDRSSGAGDDDGDDDRGQQATGRSSDAETSSDGDSTRSKQESDRARSSRPGRSQGRQKKSQDQQEKEQEMDDEVSVTPEQVGEAAETFMAGLAEAFGASATTEVSVDGTEIEIRLSGSELGLLVGPGGRTLTAVQDLARVASQRRLGDHDTRLRIDVGGYREKRRSALEKFTTAVAEQVKESGRPKALEPMSSPDRKIVHDTVVGLDGVTSRSEGDDPRRRVVISPE